MHPRVHFNVIETSHHWIEIAQNDSKERKAWRTNQALDFLFVMKKGLDLFPKTDWFVIVEDDTECNKDPSFLSRLANFTSEVKRNPKIVFTRLNRIGTRAHLLHRIVVESFLGYALTRFDLVPIDWLFFLHLETMGTRIEKQPFLDLCRHIGGTSSLAENEERSVEK